MVYSGQTFKIALILAAILLAANTAKIIIICKRDASS